MAIGKNKTSVQAYVKNETHDAIQEIKKKTKQSESKIAGKVLDEHFKVKEQRCKPNVGDIVEITGNLSPDLKSMFKPRLGQVVNVNGAYILVRPEGKTYDVAFLENEVRFYKQSTLPDGRGGEL